MTKEERIEMLRKLYGMMPDYIKVHFAPYIEKNAYDNKKLVQLFEVWRLPIIAGKPDKDVEYYDDAIEKLKQAG